MPKVPIDDLGTNNIFDMGGTVYKVLENVREGDQVTLTYEGMNAGPNDVPSTITMPTGTIMMGMGVVVMPEELMEDEDPADSE